MRLQGRGLRQEGLRRDDRVEPEAGHRRQAGDRDRPLGRHGVRGLGAEVEGPAHPLQVRHQVGHGTVELGRELGLYTVLRDGPQTPGTLAKAAGIDERYAREWLEQQAATGSSFVRTLLAAPGGVLWVGLEGEGLARLDTRRQAWTRYPPDPDQPGALANGNVRALALDLDGALWVGTTGGGLHRFANYDRKDDRRLATLAERLPAPCLGRVPRLAAATPAATSASSR